MTTTDEWREFLRRWSDEWLASSEGAAAPAAVRKARWLGYKPATEEQVSGLERRLGYRMPPSYRAFLLTTNGWRSPSAMVERVRPVSKVEWLEVDDPELVESWAGVGEGRPLEGLTPEEYFANDGASYADREHFRQGLKIADPVEGDSAIYVLSPLAEAEDGEWEAWLHAHWIPGVERYPSFAELMRAEYRTFRLVVLGDASAAATGGPFVGRYAPDRPRHAAERIGPGKLRAVRLTVEQLVDRLDDASPKVRKEATKHLFRRFAPHDPSDERPALTAQLARILGSNREAETRSAAACTMGTYGDSSAIGPLVAALADPGVAGAAVQALFYLSIYMKDSRIADGLCGYLATRRDWTSTSTAMNVLEDFGDSRLGPIALELLDSEGLSAQFRCEAAFAVAAVHPSAGELLVARLAHQDPAIRTAAMAALRQVWTTEMAGTVRAALNDPDPAVVMQAKMTLRFIEDNVR